MPFVKWRKYQAGVGKGRLGFTGMLPPNTTLGLSVAAADPNILGSVLVPANTLYKNGMALRIFAMGSFAANANAKTLALSFGSVGFLAASALTVNGQDWVIEGLIVRVGVGAQVWGLKAFDSATPPIILSSLGVTGAVDETIDNLITISVTAVGADGDVGLEALLVEVLTR